MAQILIFERVCKEKGGAGTSGKEKRVTRNQEEGYFIVSFIIRARFDPTVFFSVGNFGNGQSATRCHSPSPRRVRPRNVQRLVDVSGGDLVIVDEFLFSHFLKTF